MNEFYWHIEKAFFSLIEGPLFIRIFILSVLVGIAIGMTIISGGGTDDV